MQTNKRHQKQAYLEKYSAISLSRMLSGKLPTHRCLDSLTIFWDVSFSNFDVVHCTITCKISRLLKHIAASFLAGVKEDSNTFFCLEKPLLNSIQAPSLCFVGRSGGAEGKERISQSPPGGHSHQSHNSVPKINKISRSSALPISPVLVKQDNNHR